MKNEFRCKITYDDGTTHVFYTEETYIGKHVLWLQEGSTIEIRYATDEERELMMRGA